MSKQQRPDIEMFEIGGKEDPRQNDDEAQPVVGTQILDPSMPSDLNFEGPKEIQPSQGNVQLDSIPKILDVEISSYTIKGGKALLKIEPEYHPGSFIKKSLPTYQVKCYSQQKSQGIKKFWQAIIGYVKRQLYIKDGYIYLLEFQKEGYLVHSRWDVDQIFKIFLDNEDSKIRIVLKDQQKLITKDFQVKSISPLFEKLCEQINKVGLSVAT